MASFDAESDIPLKARARSRRRMWLGVLVVGITTAALGVAYATAWRLPIGPATAVAPTGQAQFESRPSGADVLIDGVARGKTPLKLSLPVGAHTLEIKGEAGSRSLPLTIDAGVLVSQYVELLAAPVQATGGLDISSTPPGAQVRVDGVLRGVTPLTLDQVEAREHTVSFSRGTSTVFRTVEVAAGSTATVSVSLRNDTPAPGTVGGFIELRAPFEMQVFEEGRLIGTTSTERLMVPTGRHQLELVSTPLQFRTSLTLDVAAGEVTSSTVLAPNGTLSVNALPWADVLIDGRAVGTTPLANLAIPIGSHEIVWRHPQLGERRQTLTVTQQTPVRVGVDFSK